MVKKSTNFFSTKNKNTQKQPKVQTPSGIPVFGTVGVLLGSTAGVPFFLWYCGGTAGEYCRSTFFLYCGVLLVSTAGVLFFGAVGLLLGRTAGVPLFGTVGVLWGVLQEYNFWYWFCVMASLLLVLLVCTGPSTGLVLFCVLDHSTTLNNQQILL